MIFNPRHIVAFLFHQGRLEARRVAAWTRAHQRQPELAEDILALSGLMENTPHELRDGVAFPTGLDHGALAYERGRQDLARELLALMKLTPTDLNELMESIHDDPTSGPRRAREPELPDYPSRG